ncbi:hypothetical protein MNQ95_07520 [Pseudoxanthomonas daejeonensis]|uniref:hypothetical protein n=1 Tax=Pseudoxanthomonas daejeonensis TaxID=266062 RepID=UPI001F546539|nr:hypothetical protein [Pseudoxanthomonas daejeonensis]UNK58911.1 hypothetical protein MNQ95_07520 [Pseudoxanthomonas daejeonensis]
MPHPAFIHHPLNRRHSSLNVAMPADIRTMTLIRRLSLCLLALALLPGATLQAQMSSTSVRDAVAISSTVATGDCHQAMSMPPSTDTVDAGHHPGPASGATHAGECCGDADAKDSCSGACPCPTALAALPLSSSSASDPMLQQRWQAVGFQGRDRFAEGPPRRPPIG